MKHKTVFAKYKRCISLSTMRIARQFTGFSILWNRLQLFTNLTLISVYKYSNWLVLSHEENIISAVRPVLYAMSG